MDAEMEICPALPAEEHGPDDDHLTEGRYLIVHNNPPRKGDVAHHQDNCALLADRVQKYLRNWFTCRRRDSTPVILDREEQAQEEEPAKDRGDTNRHDDTNWSRPGRIMGLLGHMRTGVES